MTLVCPAATSAQQETGGQNTPATPRAEQPSSPIIDVQISGLSDELREALQGSLTIARRRNSERLNHRYVTRLHQDTPGQLKTLLQAFGFYQASVSAKLTRLESGWLASYQVELGVPVKIKLESVRITGAGDTDPAFIQWLDAFRSTQGQAFVHSDWEAAKQSLATTAQQAGYLTGELTQHEVRVDPDANIARLVLHFDTGPLLTVGGIKFTQQAFDESFLRRFVVMRQGDRFSAQKLAELQQRLSRSDYFKQVEVRPSYENLVDGGVPIEVILAPRKPQKYTFGLGFGTDTGPRANAGFEHRRLNRRGHRLSTGWRVSQIEQMFQANYRVPLTNPLEDQLQYFANFTNEENDDRSRRTAAIGLNHISRWHQWERAVGFSYEHERSQGAALLRANHLIPALTLNRVSADNAARPNRGWRLSLGLKAASEAVLSDSSFAQLSMKGKLVYAVGEGRLIARTEVGATFAEEFGKLPLSLQYFTGGDTSVRGYAYDSLFPEESDGTTGGENLVAASIEYEYPISEQFAVAAFFDAGDAFDDSIAINRGAGFGLRWQLPFGSARIDLASALDRPGSPWRLHFTVGPDL